MGAYQNKQSNAVPALTPTISSGSGAPATTPSKVGDIYINTTAGTFYFAKGTTNSADWVAVVNV